jgi:putative glutamine amidotransferase
MPDERPVIGVTRPDNTNILAFLAIGCSVWVAGGRPLPLTPSGRMSRTAKIDGLILGGGKDVFPGLYNQSPKKEYQYDRKRDELEVFWAEQARDNGIPTLGICRGAQLMNVVCGGTLHMSVSEAYEDAHYPDGFIHNLFYRKTIHIPSGCLLNRVAGGAESLRVNSIHKQAVAALGQGLAINAQETNGVVQALAHTTHPFYLGVQFHPEFLISRKVFRGIFAALVDASRHR